MNSDMLASLTSLPVLIALSVAGGVTLVLLMLMGRGNEKPDPLARLREQARRGPGEDRTRLSRRATSDDTALEKKLEKFKSFLEPTDQTQMGDAKLKMIQAGYHGKNAVRDFHAAKLILAMGGLLIGLAYVLVVQPGGEGSSVLATAMPVLVPTLLGYYFPIYWVNKRHAERQSQITRGFPDAASPPHLPRATIETAGGSYGRDDIADYRGRAMLRAVTALTPAEMNVLHEWADATGLARSHLAEEALTSYPLPLMLCRNADGTVMDAGGGAGKFQIHSFGWGSGHLTLEGQTAQGNTKTDTLSLEFVLPPEYVAGGDVELIVRARHSGSGTAGTCTIDAEVFELDDTGSAVAIRSSSAKTLTGSWADHAFDDITVTGLDPGDRLIVFVRTSVQETGGTSSINAQIGNIETQLDIRG